MITLLTSACIEECKEKTWSILSKIDNIHLWSEPVVNSSCIGNIKNGIGAERVCNLKGNITINEKWIAWDEGNSYTYLGFNLPIVKTAKNTWSVKSENGKTLLTSESEIQLKGSFLGLLLEPLMLLIMKRMASDSLAAFKYYVENGQPFKGKYSKLPRAPVSC